MVPTARTTNPPTASVVIPNWNGLEFLKVVLPSLKKQTLKGFETIVVDNGSDDGSVTYVKKHHPKVRLIELPENFGFPVACNKGMAAAESDYIGLINNDLELHPKWTADMVAALDKYPQAGSLACKMMQYKKRDRIDEAGGFGSWYGLFYPRGREEKDTGQYDTEEPVLYACGGAVMYRKQALAEVGMFDEDLFAYLEDVDLGLRLQLAGWSCEYIPSAIVYHMGGATNKYKHVSDFSQRHWARNTRLIIWKNYPFWALIIHSPKLLIAEIKMLVGAIKDHWFKTYLHATAGVFRHLPRTLSKRRKIQRKRTATLRYLNTVISKKLPKIGTPG
jgi:GT2 family glycosyltransferase